MRKISLQARSIIRRAIVSLLSSMGFITMQGQAMDRDGRIEFDEYDKEVEFPGDRAVTLYGCPSADFKLRGRVIDKAGNPLKDVNVQVTHCKNGDYPAVLTDDDGNFSVEYMTAPWCDIIISAKNDKSSACDTILEAEYQKEFVMPENPGRDPFYDGVYTKEMTIVLGDEGEPGHFIFGRPTGVKEDVAEKILLSSNPVENYLWFNLTGVENANVAIYSLSGEQLKSASIPNGESLYVGDLKSGNYLLTVISGDKKMAVQFLKK